MDGLAGVRRGRTVTELSTTKRIVFDDAPTAMLILRESVCVRI
jgi:hypothetical protein